jgi:hypothetical protein
MIRRVLFLVSAAVTLVLWSGCSDSTGPGEDLAGIRSAAAFVNGNPVNGTIHPAHGDRMRLEARVTMSSRAGTWRVVVDHTGPGMGGSPQHHSHARYLHDDGMNGDRVPGDGLYCDEDDLDDMFEHMGQMMSGMNGPHRLDVYVEDASGNRSASVALEFRIE